MLFDTIRAGETYVADSRGPISVMGDHIHKENEVMFFYISSMEMNKNFNETKNLNLKKSWIHLMEHLTTQVIIWMLLYIWAWICTCLEWFAPQEIITLMLMLGLMEMEWCNIEWKCPEERFQINSCGISDTRLTWLFKVFDRSKFKTYVGLGLSVSTRNIHKSDGTPSFSNIRLGYGMQNGSGSYDFFSFLNNVINFEKLKLGQQFLFKQNISDKNSKDINMDIFFNLDFRPPIEFLII